jgi:predicted DNA-binding transcriptional regulator AlpA
MATDTQAEKSTRYGRIKDTCKRYGISPATYWRWVKTLPGFPKPIAAGPRVRLADWNAIDAYMAERGGAAR